MPSARISLIDRRRFVASSIVGGAAILATGQLANARSMPITPKSTAGPRSSNEVEVIWAFDGGGDVAVADGAVFFSTSSSLHAVSAVDGSSRWQSEKGGGRWAPVVLDGVVYGGHDNYFYAVRSEDGTEIWQFSTDDLVLTSPKVVDGVAYCGSMDNHLYAMNAKDGSELWRFKVSASNSAGLFASSTPLVRDGLVYVWSDDGNLWAVNAGDGSERWRLKTGGIIRSSPAVSNGIVYVGSGDKNLYAVNADDGAEKWRFTTGDEIYASPVVFGDKVYVGSADHKLYAVDGKHGTEEWRHTTEAAIVLPPVVVDFSVYVVNSKGFSAIDVEDGSERWHVAFPSGSTILAPPVVMEDVAYLGKFSDDGGILHGINTSDGAERWQLPVGDGINVSPVISSEGTIYISTENGPTTERTLYAISARVPNLSVGGAARVTETTSLRGGPAPTAVERAEAKKDTTVTITGESVTTEGVIWWPVTVDETSDQGWVEASTLEPLTNGPEPTAAP